MSNRKKIYILLISILVGLLVFALVSILAKYLSTASGDAKMTIARWDIKVNDLSIKENTDISNTLTPIFPGNDNIAANIIAPTAEGYFDLNFDFTGADVSFKYEITPSVAENSSVKDLVVSDYAIADNDAELGEKIHLDNFNDVISDTIPLNTTIKTRKVRIYVTWNDDESTQTMSNEDDTNSTKSSDSPLFHINVAFTQVAS